MVRQIRGTTGTYLVSQISVNDNEISVHLSKCTFSVINDNEINVELCLCKDGLLRVADPSFVDACQQHIISRYYNCDIKIANDTDVVNNRTWLTCPTYLGTSLYIAYALITTINFIFDAEE